MKQSRKSPGGANHAHKAYGDATPAQAPGKGSAVRRRYSNQGAVQAKRTSASKPSAAGPSSAYIQSGLDAMLGFFPDGQSVQDVAAHGVQGSGGPLPHLDTIQQSFGAHDVGGVQAHIGGEAAFASTAIGAEAYATGNHVAFAQAPDLHTAAHEAAHVVQQRGGVQLKGGVGQADDSYERHADRVADLVVQGESAEALLSQLAPPSAGSAPSSGSVQRSSRMVEATFVGKENRRAMTELAEKQGIDRPKLGPGIVRLIDSTTKDCRDVPRAQIIESPSYVDSGLVSVDPQGDPWTLVVDKLVFKTGRGTFSVPWKNVRFWNEPKSDNYEKVGGTVYPLDERGRRTFDRTNTPKVLQAAILVHEVIWQLKAQRVEYAELTMIFQGALASLGGAHAMVRGWIGSPRFQTAKETLSRRGNPKPLAGSKTLKESDVHVKRGSAPKIKPGANRDMLGQAIRHVKNHSGSPAEKARMFENLAGQITKHTKGDWTAPRLPSADGSHIFAGEYGHAVVISRTGKIYRGNVVNKTQFSFGKGGALVPNYKALKGL